jgi:methyl-accepting chemotaxis protein
MAGFTFAHHVPVTTLQDEKRIAPRADKGMLVELRQGPELRKAVTHDFSLVGLSFGVSQRLNKDAPIEVAFYMPRDDAQQYEKQVPVKIKAKVAWQREDEGKLWCGLEFVDVDAATRQQIKECFAFFNQPAEFSR